MKYELLKSQAEFVQIPHCYKLDVALYQGGYGSGKTFCGALLGILLVQKYPGIRGLVGAQTFPLVRDTTMVQYFEHLESMGFVDGEDYKYLKSESVLKFSNGSEILFRHFDEPSKLKSLNLGFVEIEEMSDIPEDTFLMLLARLRQAGIDRYRLFGHTNPEGNKGWIYRHFVEKKPKNYRLIVAPTTQNKFLPDGFVESLKEAYDSEYYKINVLGEFGDYATGLVTKGFSEDNIKDIGYHKDLPLHLSCDFNVDPMSWVVAHKSENKAYFIDEIVVENTTTLECVNYFHNKYKEHKAPIIINGDASGDNRSVQSEYTNYVQMKNRLKELGFKDVRIQIKPYNPPIKARIHAWNSKMLNTKGERCIFINPRCKWLLYNIHNLKYKAGTSILDLPSHSQIKSSNKLKFLGHIFDAASYMIDYYCSIRLV